MAVIPDPRTSYHEEPHNLFPGPHDPSSATDTVEALWVLVPAVAAVLVLIWLISATALQPPRCPSNQTRSPLSKRSRSRRPHQLPRLSRTRHHRLSQRSSRHRFFGQAVPRLFAWIRIIHA